MPTRQTFTDGNVLTGAQLNSELYGADGWIKESLTWTYASASTFTISGDLTAIYTKGTRLWFTNSGTKYGVVVSSAFAAGNTTVTIAVNTDYTIANAAITAPYYSHAISPAGYPSWFNWSPSFTGFSANPSGGVYRYRVDGAMVTAAIRQPNNGTSNATTFTISLPITAATVSSHAWVSACMGVDAGTSLTAASQLQIASAGTTMSAFKDFSGAAWTNSGNKRIPIGNIQYEI